MGLARLVFSTGPRRHLTGWLTHALAPFAALIAVWVIYENTIGTGDLFAMTISFLSVMLAMIFVTVGAHVNSNVNRPSILDFIFAAAALAAGSYFYINSETIITRISLMDPLSVYDLTSGTAIFLLTIEATRRTVGMALTSIVLIFVAYNLLGHHLPGAFGHGHIGYQHFLDMMAFTTDGIFGVPLKVSATYVFLFVLFGTFLNRAGGGEFFFNPAAAISGRKPGGPAKIAVVSSGLYGTISGSPTSDVVTTGSITIPMMRRLGYSPGLAGGVEVAASTGGSLLPPVMGSAAFIMAEYTGIAYRDIVVAGLIPALLYYIGIYAQVHLRSLRLGLSSLDEKEIPKLADTLRQGAVFLVPLAVLIAALLEGYSPTFVAAFGALSVVGVAALRKKTRMSIKDIYHTLAKTTVAMVPVTAACAAAGLVIGGLTMTGLAGKFAALVFMLTASIVPLTLFLAGALTILLGMGMPTPSVYVLAAVLIGPLLERLGFPLLAAHMFLLYFSCLSALTPPVAVAAFAASAITQSNPLQIAVTATRLAIVAFVIPFAFLYSQEVLLQGAPLEILLAGVFALLGTLVLALAVEGYWKAQLAWWGRLLLAASAVCFFAPTLGWTILSGAGLTVAAFVACPGLRSYGTVADKTRPPV